MNLISESQIDSSNHVSIAMNKTAQKYFNFKYKIYTWLESRFKFCYYVKELFKILKINLTNFPSVYFHSSTIT